MDGLAGVCWDALVDHLRETKALVTKLYREPACWLEFTGICHVTVKIRMLKTSD